MEKNRIRSVKTGKSMRMSYQRQEEVLEMPNLIEVQKNSYQWFLDEGLKEAFADKEALSDKEAQSGKEACPVRKVSPGKVVLVGAGCLSYEYITLRGMQEIRKAQVLIYDALIDTRLLD
mgnify:CR=1 FL=1